MDSIATSMGFVPPSDTSAQNRCYKFMKDAMDQLDREIAELSKTQSGRDSTPTGEGPPGSEDPLTLCKNQKQQIQNQVRFLEPNAGGHSMNKAKAFWQNWDKSKENIIRTVMMIETDGEHIQRDKIFDKMQELESGRYKE